MSDATNPLTFDQFREAFPNVSTRSLKRLVAKHGIGSRICGKLFFYRSDVEKLMKATACHSKSFSGAESGTFEEPCLEDASEKVLRLIHERTLSTLRTGSKQGSVKKAFTGKRPKRRSQMQSTCTSKIIPIQAGHK
jgi:hypothetical protein